jgi:glycosyltransferase involved in cell wall biosynthesis
VWLEKEMMPWAPSIVDLGGIGTAPPYVVDYDDATFHTYDQHPNRLLRRVYARKIDAVMRSAAAVVVGNEYLAARAERAGARNIVQLPSAVDENEFRPCTRAPRCGLTFGWIGSPGSQDLLEPLLPIVAAAISGNDRFVTVGTTFSQPRFQNHEICDWSLASEASAVGAFDVGVMPVRDAAFERGKCGYKLIQYMACGLPVIASPVGVNRQIVTHGLTGFLAETPEEWQAAIARLSHDEPLRCRMGEAGRRVFLERYALSVVAPKLAEVLRSCATRSRR